MPRPAGPPSKGLALQPFSTATGRGQETARRLGGPAYVRLMRGAYWVAGEECTHGRVIQAARAVLGEGAVLGGRSAAWAHGVRLADPAEPVEVVLAQEARVRQRHELRVRCDVLAPGETVRTPLGLATSPARTAFDLARRSPSAQALAWVDALVRRSGIAPAEAIAICEQHRGGRGVRAARTVLGRADGGAESVRESMLRWHLLEAGLPAPTPQYMVRDGAGGFVARLDLAWPALRIAVEYDGDHHRQRWQHARDLARHNRLRALGWIVIQVDAAQLADLARLIATMRGLISKRARRL